MASSTATSDPVYVPPGSDATLSDILGALRRHWRWVALPTLLAFVASAAFVMLATPRYTGEARLLLQTSENFFTRPGSTERYEQAPLIDEQAVASQVQVVMSRDLAREVIKRLGLVGNREFDPDVDGPGPIRRLMSMAGLRKDREAKEPEDRVLEAYFERLAVYPVGKSRIVAIEFRSEDPELAARGANAVAEVYLSLQEDAKKEGARSASTWLGTNIDALRNRLSESEARVEAFRSRSGLLTGSGQTTLSAQQLSELSTQLAQARTQRDDMQSKAKLIRDVIRDGRAFEIPDIANNELVRRLQEQRINLRAQLALEQRTLLPQHPRIKELNAQLQDLEGQVRGAGERTAKSLENDARLAGSRVDSLEAAIESQKKVVASANESEVQLRALEREARTQREQLETYLGRYREAMVRDSDFGVPADARIVSRAVVPQTPSFPRKGPIVGLVTLAALLISAGVIVARELLTSRPGAATTLVPYELARYAPPAESAGPRPFKFEPSFAVAKTRMDERGEAAIETPDPRYDFGRLVQRLGASDIGRRGRRVLVAGLGPESAVTEVARGLALTLSGRQRVILFSAEADETALADAEPGFTDLVAGEATFSDVIAREPTSNLHRISTGTLVNEALTAHRPGVGIVLAALGETYDWVVGVLVGRSPELLDVFASAVDVVVIASDLEPANPELVAAYEAAKSAGATDVVIARGQGSEPLEEAA